MDKITAEGMEQQEYVDILTNGGFKAFFGDENNKEEVMVLINALLPEHRKVVEIDYRPTELQGPVIGHSKEFQYDFVCRDNSGAVFIVEMQRYREDVWFKRCVSYASRAYDRQNKAGLGYDVPPVYLIGLMGVDIDHPDKEYWKDRYISEYTFREKECHDLLGETICIIFAELTRFCKSEDECETEQDRLLYLLKNSPQLRALPKWGNEGQCKRILDAFRIRNFDERKRNKYTNDMYDEYKLLGQLKAARKEGEAISEARTLARRNAEIATAMLADGVDIAIICKYTNLTPEEVEKLRQ
ncbi:MAG: hypothetical protein E7112_04885 [Bacteroidales bacterium]|nr:hypothetical protein [Bacteroidales bacterium]